MIGLLERFILHPFEFKTSRAEIDQQADFQVVGLEVVDGLGQMGICQFDNGLQLEGDDIFHQKIHPPGADMPAFVIDGHDLFAAEGKALIGHLYLESTLVDHFLPEGRFALRQAGLKPIAQSRMHGHGTTDDSGGQL